MPDDESFDYEPPTVTWEPITKRTEEEDDDGRIVVVQETVGHKVEPPWDEEWTPLVKLRWFAALIEHRTGVGVRVAQAPMAPAVRVGPDYLVALSHMEYTTPTPYEVVWGWLSGLEAGIYEGRVTQI